MPLGNEIQRMPPAVRESLIQFRVGQGAGMSYVMVDVESDGPRINLRRLG
jgi:hypothetical protein